MVEPQTLILIAKLSLRVPIFKFNFPLTAVELNAIFLNDLRYVVL